MSVLLDEARQELVLAWPPVKDAVVYTVSINSGTPEELGSVDSVRIPLTSVSPLDYITVAAFAPGELVPDNQIADMTLVVSDYSSVGEAVTGEAVDFGTGAEVSSGMNSELAAGVSAASAPIQTIFTFKTFIPESYVEAPLLCGGSWPFPNNHYFGGNNRSWSYLSNSIKTKQRAILNWTGSDSTDRAIGQTIRYKSL